MTFLLYPSQFSRELSPIIPVYQFNFFLHHLIKTVFIVICFRMSYLWVSLCIGLVKSVEHNVFTTINAAALPYYESTDTFLFLNQVRSKLFAYRI